MALEDSTGFVDRLATAAESPGTQPLNAMSRPVADRAAEWLDRVEAVMERYPWPTLLLALGVGYVISRRMR